MSATGFARALVSVLFAFNGMGLARADAFPEHDAGPPPGVTFFDLRAAAALDDFHMGGRVGLGTLSRIAWDFFLDFEMRPYRRAVRIRESESLEYQFREERFTIGPGALVRFPLGSAGASYTLGVGLGLSPAWYRGSSRAASSSVLGWLETGFRFVSPSGVDWGAAYQFVPLSGVSSHRVALSVGYRLKSL